MPPTLLTLPAELRLSILYYALLPCVPPTSDPELITTDRRARTLQRIRCRVFWKPSMSALLRVNHQLSLEVEDVLYKSFVFCYTPLGTRQLVDWAGSLSSRVRAIVGRIEFRVVLSRMTAERAGRSRDEWRWVSAVRAVEDNARELSGLLPALREVRLRVIVFGLPLDQIDRGVDYQTAGSEKMQDAIIRIARHFKNVTKVELDAVSKSAWSDAVVESCKRRIEKGEW